MDANATTEVTAQPEAKPKRKGRILRFLRLSFTVLVITGFIAHFVWKYSGSGKWEKEGEKYGVVVYGLKEPGQVIKKYKAVWHMNTKLSQFVMWASDAHPPTKHSMRNEAGLYDHRVLDQDGNLRASWTTWKVPFGPYLSPREFVARAQFSQNPVTKKLTYTVTGEPQRIPHNDCCVRIPLMLNTWTLTPTKAGDLEVEWFIDMDLGGNMPYFAQNTFMPKGLYRFGSRVHLFIEQDKYKDAKYDWIEEPAAPTSITQTQTPVPAPLKAAS